MSRNKSLENVKNFIKEKMIIIKYRSKCKKFNISSEFLSCFSYRSDDKDVIDILNIINRSSNIENFRENIYNYVKHNINNVYNPLLLIGNLTGNYNFYNFIYKSKEIDINNIRNFNYENRNKILEVLKVKVYDYIMNNNSLKNEFYEQKNLVKNLTGEVDFDNVINLFQDVIDGKEVDDNHSINAAILQEYIFSIVNRYTFDDIVNNYDFIEYDMQNKNDDNLDQKRQKYHDNKNIKTETLIRINNLKILEDRLEKINTQESKELLEQLKSIDDPYKSPQKIEDIYLEYEILFRNDLINKLFIPTMQETVVDDFRNVRPQMIHCFIRNPKKFREKLEEQIIDKIIRDRTNKNESRILSNEEQERFNKILNKLEVELNQTQVNYTYDSSSVSKYTDSTGFDAYISDTSNQIATSIYSENYFNNLTGGMIGIGFNSEGLLPEAIALSSPSYLTTNKGLNNIEYNSGLEFSKMSSCYNELIKNDGRSEVVLFRRNIDYDTKASYIFVAFDSNYDRNYQELINEGRKLAKENNMKLVLYDLQKIRDSYHMFLQSNNEIQYEVSNEEIKIK